MLKYTILVYISCIQFIAVSGQWITQSADGKGSFLFKGANINFDAVSSDFSFSINNMSRPLLNNSNKDNSFWLYGGSVHAKSQEGLGNLFSQGDFVPSGEAKGYFGVRLSNSFDAENDRVEKRLNQRLQFLAKHQIDEFIGHISGVIDLAISNSDLNATTDSPIINRIRKEWNKSLNDGKIKTFLDFVRDYAANNNVLLGAHVAVVRDIADIVINVSGEDLKRNDNQLDKIRSRLIEADRKYLERPLYNFTLFTFGGFNGTSFKRVDSILTSNPSKSFISEDFRGGNWGIGVNYQIAQWKLGLTYAYKMTNNFDLLDKTDYKLTTSYASGSQTLTKEKQITAYSGTYGTVEINEVNADVLCNIDLSKEDNVYALLDAYLRGTAYSRNKSLLPNNYTIGLGSYFFGKASKFMGGLYVELPDVSNAFEKQKDPADQNIRPALKRLTFGLVGKFSLNSLISWQ